ncbi:hypothetical protein ABEF95_014585 [Exophiala dermatitidis]
MGVVPRTTKDHAIHPRFCFTRSKNVTMIRKVYNRKHRGFAVPKSVVLEEKRRLAKTRKKRADAAPLNPLKTSTALVSSNVESPIMALPNEALLLVFENLDVPSRISFALTNKFFAQIGQKVSTDLTDVPSVTKYHKDCAATPCIRLDARGSRLCWMCLKYTKIKQAKWTTTHKVDFSGIGRLGHPHVDCVDKVHAHRHCLTSIEFGQWAWTTEGACGGFGRFEGKPKLIEGSHLYNAGF